jgi:hypothetical protein
MHIDPIMTAQVLGIMREKSPCNVPYVTQTAPLVSNERKGIGLKDPHDFLFPIRSALDRELNCNPINMAGPAIRRKMQMKSHNIIQARNKLCFLDKRLKPCKLLHFLETLIKRAFYLTSHLFRK